MTVLIQVSRLVARMIVMLTGDLLLPRLVAVTVLVEVTWHMPRVVVVRTGHLLLTGLVAMAVLVQVSWLVAGMVVVLTGLFLRHVGSPWAAESESNMRHAPLSPALAQAGPMPLLHAEITTYILMSLEEQAALSM